MKIVFKISILFVISSTLVLRTKDECLNIVEQVDKETDEKHHVARYVCVL